MTPVLHPLFFYRKTLYFEDASTLTFWSVRRSTHATNPTAMADCLQICMQSCRQLADHLDSHNLDPQSTDTHKNCDLIIVYKETDHFTVHAQTRALSSFLPHTEIVHLYCLSAHFSTQGSFKVLQFYKTLKIHILWCLLLIKYFLNLSKWIRKQYSSSVITEWQ